MSLRLNIGSGQRPFKSPFINVDVNPRWGPDVVANGASMPMFADNSADLIVSHHNVEHYGCGEAWSMIQECHRILEPRGSLLIFVPDMRELADMWIEGKLSDQVYFTNVYGAFMNHEGDRHRWGYTRRTMAEFLSSLFTVRPFDWRVIPGADIARDRWILGVEAVK